MAKKKINKKITPTQVLCKAWRTVRRDMRDPMFSGLTDHERKLMTGSFMLTLLINAHCRDEITEQQLYHAAFKVKQELGLIGVKVTEQQLRDAAFKALQ